MGTKSGRSSKVLKTTAAAAKTDGVSSTRNSLFNFVPGEIDWAKITASTLTVELTDGRTLHISSTVLSPVYNLPFREKRNFVVVDDGAALEWPALRYKVTLRQLMGVK